MKYYELIWIQRGSEFASVSCVVADAGNGDTALLDAFTARVSDCYQVGEITKEQFESYRGAPWHKPISTVRYKTKVKITLELEKIT